ncbi:uncharacterized protein G2W53_039126 [Senna tora]|uniref:Uncharacterized protein n=1 Tax=Senna tora TaxID=362788 RepID=A0A834SM05_9FABA|nr:uncharacterized protein G2W53_039126 [Senna tora]
MGAPSRLPDLANRTGEMDDWIFKGSASSQVVLDIPPRVVVMNINSTAEGDVDEPASKRALVESVTFAGVSRPQGRSIGLRLLLKRKLRLLKERRCCGADMLSPGDLNFWAADPREASPFAFVAPDSFPVNMDGRLSRARDTSAMDFLFKDLVALCKERDELTVSLQTKDSVLRRMQRRSSSNDIKRWRVQKKGDGDGLTSMGSTMESGEEVKRPMGASNQDDETMGLWDGERMRRVRRRREKSLRVLRQ